MAWGLDRMRKSTGFWEYGILTGKPKRLGDQCAPADGVPPLLTSPLAPPNIVPPSYQLNRFFVFATKDRILGLFSGKSWRPREPATGFACSIHSGE